MSISIPSWVKEARASAEIQKAAEYLHKVDALQAIGPLAALERRAPSWLMIQLALTGSVMAVLVAFGMALAAIIGGAWLIFNASQWYLQSFDPQGAAVWWAGWLVLIAIWLWRDERLRSLLSDERFALSKGELSLVGAALLWPVQVAAKAMRLCVALCFLTLMFAPPLAAALMIARAWRVWLSPETPVEQYEWLTYGFAAGIIYLLFGLWVFSDWPRGRRPARSIPFASRMKRIVLAAVLAFGLGLLLWALSGDNRQWIGLSIGGFFFILIYWFLNVRSGGLYQPGWLARERLRVAFSNGQVRFLRATLFLLGMMGIGAVANTVAENWDSMRPLIPAVWLWPLQSWFEWNINSRVEVYYSLEGWIVGGIVGGLAAALALIYATGWGVRLAKPFAWHYFWFRDAVANLAARSGARLAVGRAIKHHRQRNRQQVGGRGRLAVCRDHLARFERQTVWLSYWRKWHYWQCRVCHSDAQALAGVRVMRGVFDQSMTELLKQDGGALAVNLLLCADGADATMPLDLQEARVVSVGDPHAIEAFVAAYQNFAPSVKTPKLKQVRLSIAPAAALDANTERMLRNTFGV